MYSFSGILDLITKKTGKAFSWLNVILVVLICGDVVMRYFFSLTRVWIIELEWHFFALIFLLGAAFTFNQDRHVRVDLFYQKASEKTKAWINLSGILFFLIPWCLVIMRAANKYAYNAWIIKETSPDPGGLPARFIIKYAIVVGFFLLLLQAVSVAFKCCLVILDRRETVFD
jgi:TRAP-type mannitol/chloroaromatic compound transport system permease small subunit